MALRSAVRDTPYLLGSDSADVALTNSYTGNTISFPTSMYIGGTLYIKYVPAQNSRKIYVLVEGSPDGTVYFPVSISLDGTTGVSELFDNEVYFTGTSGGSTYKKRFVIPVNDKYLRISIKEDGSANFGTASVMGTFKIPDIASVLKGNK